MIITNVLFVGLLNTFFDNNIVNDDESIYHIRNISGLISSCGSTWKYSLVKYKKTITHGVYFFKHLTTFKIVYN